VFRRVAELLCDPVRCEPNQGLTRHGGDAASQCPEEARKSKREAAIQTLGRCRVGAEHREAEERHAGSI